MDGYGTPAQTATFYPSPAWTCSWDASKDQLTVSGGDDEVFGLLELEPVEARLVADGWSSGQPLPPLSPSLKDALLAIGALVLGKRSDSTDTTADRQLEVVVRTGGSRKAFVDQAQKFHANGVAYLMVDAAMHHTLSIGPLVVPGETACAMCMILRLQERWPLPDAPEAPLVANNRELINGAVAQESIAFAEGRSTLANATVEIDLRNWQSTRNTLLRHPQCEWCETNAIGATE